MSEETLGVAGLAVAGLLVAAGGLATVRVGRRWPVVAQLALGPLVALGVVLVLAPSYAEDEGIDPFEFWPLGVVVLLCAVPVELWGLARVLRADRRAGGGWGYGVAAGAVALALLTVAGALVDARERDRSRALYVYSTSATCDGVAIMEATEIRDGDDERVGDPTGARAAVFADGKRVGEVAGEVAPTDLPEYAGRLDLRFALPVLPDGTREVELVVRAVGADGEVLPGERRGFIEEEQPTRRRCEAGV